MEEIDFGCTVCGKCCHDLRLPLTVDEAISWLQRGGRMELLCEAIPWPVDLEPDNALMRYRHARSSAVMSGTLPVRISIILAAAFTGPCPNLGAGMRCGIYEERPLVCRIYPAEVNPFIPLTPENKACPPEAWQTTPLLRQGKLVDEHTYRSVEQSRLINQQDAPARIRVCSALGLDKAALANEGYVIYSPESGALIAALHDARAAREQDVASREWTLVSNRRETVDTLASVGATSRLPETSPAAGYQYLGFFGESI